MTKFDPYPLLKLEETTSTLYGSMYFSTFDNFPGFYHVNIEEDKENTGFTVAFEHYELNRLPFGLSKCPSDFQRLMDMVIKNLTGVKCWIFDIIIFSKSAEERALTLENVLQRYLTRRTYNCTLESADSQNHKCST